MSSLNTVDTQFDGDILNRALPIRVVDVILATLQAAFSSEVLIDGRNPLRFNRDDPKNSRVWVCSPEARLDSERDGRRMFVTVERSDYVPSEMHMQNYAGGNLTDQSSFTDLASTMVMVHCEGGNRSASEFLAFCCYSILKLFRRQIINDFDMTNMHLVNISTPRRQDGIPGDPWITTVTLKVELQEFAFMTELANHLNQLSLSIQQNMELNSSGLPVYPAPTTSVETTPLPFPSVPSPHGLA